MLKVCGETSYIETLEQFVYCAILKHDIKFSNMILGSVIINFNRFQIFDAKIILPFHYKSYYH